jgi:glycosyltransferase involved in cell wall biosynthesis
VFLRKSLASLRPFDAIVINTGTLGYLMATARAMKVPVVTHVHEMRQWLTTRVRSADLEQTLTKSDAVIACSMATRTDLVALGCDEKLITVVHEPLPARRVAVPDVRRRLREMLGVPLDTLVVAGAGTADRRKGADLFLQLGVRLAALSDRDICAPWFGDLFDDDGAWLEHDVRLAATNVHFVGPVSNLPDLVHGVDVFCLTSREDPFPLVMIEAAAAGVPVVAFRGSGGADEFLAGGAGLLVPYLNVMDMAQGVTQLLADPDAVRRMAGAGRAATKALAPELIAAEALDVLRRAVAGESARDG